MSSPSRPQRPSAPGPAPVPTRRRRTTFLLLAVVVLVVVAGVVVVRSRSSSSSSAAAGSAAPAAGGSSGATGVVTAARRDLRNDQTFDGTVSSSTAAPGITRTNGIVTALPAEGTALKPGDAVFTVGDTTTWLMTGAVPAWRDLGPATTPGPDVAQLKANLKALGDDPGGRIGDGEAMDAATAAAIVHLQERLGLSPTGTLPLGTVLFEPVAVKIGHHAVEPGASVSSGSTVTELTTPALTVTFTLPTDVHTVLRVGQPVQVTLPDRSTVEAPITTIGTTTDASTGTTTQTVTVTIADPGGRTVAEGSPVKVTASQTLASNVVVVPAPALTSRVDGSWAVTVSDGSGTHVQPVTIGIAVNGTVEIRDGLADGTKVVVPRTS